MSGIPKVAVAGLDALLRRIGETVNALIDRAPLIGEDNEGLNADTLDDEEGTYYLDLANATGELADARLSDNVPLKNAENAFSDAQKIQGEYTTPLTGVHLFMDVAAATAARLGGATTSGNPAPLRAWGSTFTVQTGSVTPTDVFAINASGNFACGSGTVTTNYASASEFGRAGAPSRDVSASGNTAASDMGGTIRFTGGSGQTFTLDSDPPEDAVVVLDNAGGAAWTIAASGTLIWAVTAGTGNLTLADDGLAVALHRGFGVWIITGGGLSS